MDKVLSNYIYHLSDLRGDREIYMYTPFHGVSFLDDYQMARNQIVSELQSKLETSVSTAEDIQKKLICECDIAVPDPGQGSVETEALIHACTISLFCNAASAGQIDKWLEVFCHKFEVAKCLRKAYGSNLKPVSDAQEKLEVSTEVYAYLAFCFAMRLKEQSNLKWLNILLKLNDLLSFQVNEIKHPEAVYVFIESIKEEQNQIQKLCEKKGLKWEKAANDS